MVGGNVKFPQEPPKNVAASAAAQFKLNTIMAAMTADWLTSYGAKHKYEQFYYTKLTTKCKQTSILITY